MVSLRTLAAVEAGAQGEGFCYVNKLDLRDMVTLARKALLEQTNPAPKAKARPARKRAA